MSPSSLTYWEKARHFDAGLIARRFGLPVVLLDNGERSLLGYNRFGDALAVETLGDYQIQARRFPNANLALQVPRGWHRDFDRFVFLVSDRAAADALCIRDGEQVYSVCREPDASKPVPRISGFRVLPKGTIINLPSADNGVIFEQVPPAPLKRMAFKPSESD